MSSNRSGAYDIEFLSGDNLVERISALFEKNGDSKSLEHLRWQYLNSPAGIAYTAVAVSPDGDDAAAYSVFRVFGEINGKRVLMVQSIDTLTDSQHRGKGLFTLLSRAVYEACESDVVSCVYGFPNSNSAPGFFRKLDWENLGHPPFQFHLCNILFPLTYVFKFNFSRLPNVFLLWFVKYQLSRRLRKTGASLDDGADFGSEEYASLWESLSRWPVLKVCRDGPYMSWRYKRKPGELYQYISIRGQDESLQGVVVFRLADKHGGRIGYIMDVITKPEHIEFAKMLVQASIIRCYEQGADVVLAWSSRNSPIHSAYKGAAFLPMARKLQPIKLHFGLRRFGAKLGDIGEEGFFVSYADSDTV